MRPDVVCPAEDAAVRGRLLRRRRLPRARRTTSPTRRGRSPRWPASPPAGRPRGHPVRRRPGHPGGEAARSHARARSTRAISSPAFLGAPGSDLRAEATLLEAARHRRLVCRRQVHGSAAAEVRRLIAHVAEPDGSAWTDTKWVAQAAEAGLTRGRLSAGALEVQPHAVDVAEAAAGALDVGVALARHDEPLEAEAETRPTGRRCPSCRRGGGGRGRRSTPRPRSQVTSTISPYTSDSVDLELVTPRRRPRA